MIESALTLKTPPDTYRCSWKLSKPPEEETWQTEGDVTLLGDRQPAGAVYGRTLMSGRPAGLPLECRRPSSIRLLTAS